MNELVGLYVKTEIKKKWWKYLKQLLYLIPITSLILLLSSSQNIKYMNQKEFLNATDYSSISIIDKNKGDNVFEEYNGNVAVVEETRGVNVYLQQYKCEIFNMVAEQYDFEKTYFSKKNMCDYSLSELKEDEVIISYDVSKKLKVKVNDEICLFSDENDIQKKLTVAGIMKTKYCYQKIGSSGTIILNLGVNSELNKLYGDANYYRFETNKNGSILKEDELKECNYYLLPIKSVVMVNIVFPLLGIALIIGLMSIKWTPKVRLYAAQIE